MLQIYNDGKRVKFYPAWEGYHGGSAATLAGTEFAASGLTQVGCTSNHSGHDDEAGFFLLYFVQDDHSGLGCADG